MRARIFFLGIVVFWVVMNYLLWRSQWAAHSGIGSSVPVEAVWEKILTAPDNSALDIYDHDQVLGVCHWVPMIAGAGEAVNRNLREDYAPDGTIQQVSGYWLKLDGFARLGASNRIRFDTTLKLSTNRTWQEMHARVSARPSVWDVRATAATERVVLSVDDETGKWQRTLKFSDLEDPSALLGDSGSGNALGFLAGAGLAREKDSVARRGAGIQWQAHEDWMQFGHTKARVYRVETDFLGQHIYLFISRVGEVLWAEFPNKLTFRNEAFEHF